jgi:hypothetical protein
LLARLDRLANSYSYLYGQDGYCRLDFSFVNLRPAFRTNHVWKFREGSIMSGPSESILDGWDGDPKIVGCFFTVEVHVQNQIRSSLLPENANGIHILTSKYIVLKYQRGQGPALGHLERSLEFASEAQRQSLAFRREFFLELLFTQRDNGSVTRSD